MGKEAEMAFFKCLSQYKAVMHATCIQKGAGSNLSHASATLTKVFCGLPQSF
jgi:hypothetical protein